MPKDRTPRPAAEKPKHRPAKGSPSTPPPVPVATPMAGFDFEDLNRRFMQRAGDAAQNDAAAYGATVEPTPVQPGQVYWKVIGVHHLTPDENRDRHNAFIEALDEGGRRVRNPNLRVGSIWEGKSDGPDRPKPLDKPDNEAAADVPLEKGMTMTVWLEGAGPSERVTNLHTRHEDEVGPEGGRNSRFHHSYYIVFQRTQAGASTGDGGSSTGSSTGSTTGSSTGSTTGNTGTSGGTGSGTDTGNSGGDMGTAPPQPFRFLCWPTDHLQIIQAFGANPEIYMQYGFPGHEGVDIVAAENDPIYCVAPGTVKMINTPDAYAVNGHAYGIHVRVLHQDGYETIYAHFKLLYVGEGDTVAAGQVLGLADHTGNVWGDPADHLHLTLKHAGETAPGYRSNIVDPMPFLLPLLQGDGAAPVRPIGLGTAQVRVAQKLGLNCNAPIEAGGAITARLAAPQLIAETGVQWVRLNFIVRGFGGPDDPRWVDTYRRIIGGLRGQGLRIYGLIGAEAHTEDPGNQFRDPPPPSAVDNAWIAGYAANFRRILELFGSDLAVVESFNEPNDWHRTPSDPTAWEKAWVDPGWFAVMLQAVYDAVHDLPVTLVSGPLLSTQGGNDAAAYLPRVYQAGIERFGWGQDGRPFPFDGVGFHPYVASNPDDPQTEIPARYRQYIAEVREAIARFEPLGKPLYLSEIGWQNAEDRQAVCMEAGLGCALDDPAVALCFWYGMQDDGGGESYGLYRRNGLGPGDRKPVYDRFVALAGSGRSVAAARPWSKQPGAVFVAELDSTPDDTVLGSGQGFTKVWRLRNSGATTWGPDYKFVLVDGPALGAPPVAVPTCAPGQTADFTLRFTTPAAEGQYTSTWSLADPQGISFGDKVWTRINVLAPAGVPQPQPEGLAALSPLTAAALGIIQQTYWLRVAAAASAPDQQAAIQAAGDDALRSIRALME